MTVGERIRQRRIELNLTQEELGKRLGYGKSAICRVEKEGNNITTDRISKFAKALECSPGYLMGWTSTVDFEITDPPAFIQTSGDRKETLANKLYESYLKASPEIQQAVDLLLKADKQD